MKMSRLSRILILLIAVAGAWDCSVLPEGTAVSEDGVLIHYDDQGTGEPALVFVHGWGAERTGWKGQIDYFSEKTRVVTLDLAGFGESGNDRREWTMEAFGGDVVSVLERLEIRKAVLVGHSMGAYAVLEAARKVPRRVAGIVPVDMLQDVEESYTDELIEPRLVRFRNYVESPEVTSSTVGWMPCIEDAMAYRSGRLLETLRVLSAPVCCINSDQQPTRVDVARKHHPRFDARIIEGSGHAVMLDAPEAFNLTLGEIVGTFSQVDGKEETEE